MRFVVLVGSYARGDQDRYSDCDVLLIDADELDFDRASVRIGSSVEVGFVKFDNQTFESLYKNGSLFLYHAFQEGRLLRGDRSCWESLKGHFQVKRNFLEELMEIASTTQLLASTEIFGGTFLTPLSAAFTELKNACVFRLAHKQEFQFNKARCFELAISGVRSKDLARLKSFYDYSVRRQPVDLPFDPRDVTRCTDALRSVNEIIGGMVNDCRS